MNFYQLWPRKKPTHGSTTETEIRRSRFDADNRSNHWHTYLPRWVYGLGEVILCYWPVMIISMIFMVTFFGLGYWIGINEPCSEMESFDIRPLQ